MDTLKEDDIVLYCDSGNELDMKKKPLILDMMQMVKKDQIMASYPAEYDPDNGNIPMLNEIHWNKHDLLEYLRISLDDPMLLTNQIQSGTILLIKNSINMQIMNEWYTIANHYHLIDDSPSILPNSVMFREHRHDQSIFSLLIKKHQVLSKTTLEKAIHIIRNRSGISQL